MKKQFLTILHLVGLMVFAVSAFAQNAAPQEKNKREADLLELVKLDKTIKLDIRYARTDNFVGKIVYPEARAFLQRPAAEAVVRIHKLLKKQGLGIVIFDGYRPWSITKLFWEVTPDDKRKFVANPKTGSRHNRGCAVDLSIYDLKTGKLVPMPSDFDEFTERASPAYKDGTAEETKNRELLRKLMEAEGFTVNANEWWHFDHVNWQTYAIYDISFGSIGELDRKLPKPKIEEKKGFKKFFDAADVTGGIYIYDLKQNKYTIFDRKRMDTGYIPASTSKIIHSLMFLDSGALKDENEIIKWDGVSRSRPEWNQDLDLKTALKVSAAWFYLEASKRLTRERMQGYYDAVNYGNRNAEGFGEIYWVKGDLRITPKQQIDFLIKFYQNRLPFSPQVISTVKEILVYEKNENYVIHAKTGWSDAYTPQIGWWIGYVERKDNTYFFATEIDIKKDADAAKRQEVTKNLLCEMKIID